MDYFSNRLVGNSEQPSGSFFFEFDYWLYDDTVDPVELNGELYVALKSATDGRPMSQKTLSRFYGLS